MFSIIAGQGVQIGVDTFRGERIGNEVVECKMVYLDGLWTCPRCSGLDEVIQGCFCELCEYFVAKLVASLEGFEPTTRCLEGSRSIQLSYRDNQIKYNMMELE